MISLGKERPEQQVWWKSTNTRWDPKVGKAGVQVQRGAQLGVYDT